MSRLKGWQQPLLWSLMPGLLWMAACTGGPGESPTPPATASPSFASSSPTPAPTSSSPIDPSEAGAQAAVVRFWKVLDRLSADPKSSLTEIFTVARGEVADQYIQNITEFRADRVRQVGSVSVENLSAERLKKRDRYRVTACVDVGATDLIDKAGKSVVAKDAPTRTESRYEVQKDGGKWYVLAETTQTTC